MADETVVELLIEWGFESLTEPFLENGVDVEALGALDDASIRILIPKIGEYAKFNKKLTAWKSANYLIATEIECIPQMVSVNPLDIKTVEHKETDVPINDVGTCIAITPQPAAEPETPNKTSITPDIFIQDHTFNLEGLLGKTLSGLAIRAAYKNQRNKLQSADRTKLTQIISEWLCENRISCTQKIYQDLAKQIVVLFSSENEETYFIPASKHSKGKYSNASGKIVDCHRNLQSAYVALGLLPRKRSRTSTVEDTEAPLETILCDAEIDDEQKELLAWIKNSLEPWSEVMEKWRATHQLRMRNTHGPRIDVLHEFPVLRQPSGYTLIDIDFSLLHPKKANLFFGSWDQFRLKIIEQASIRQFASEEAKQYLLLAKDEDSTTDIKDLSALLLLPCFCASNLIHKYGKETWRPSVSEIERAFICYIQTAAEVQPTIEKKYEECKKKKLTLQPFIVIVGSSIKTIETFYVVIDKVFYKVDTILKAVDICFKSFFVFNCKYPFECQILWLFMQKHIYDIHSQNDPKCSKVATLLSDFKN